MEIKYGKEPLDSKLCLIRMLRKWWILPISILGSAILFGGIYFLTQIVFGPARTYVAESEYYVEYKDAITYEQQYTYYNQNTWESLGYTDLFMDTVKEQIAQQGYDFSDEELKASFTTTLLTDVRVVHATVSTTDAKLTMAISDSLEKAFVLFGEEQREIDEIRLITSPKEATLKALDNRTIPAAILGAVVALFVTLFVMYIYVITDTSFFIPVQLTRRYGIHASTRPVSSEESVFYVEGESTLYVKAMDKNAPVIEKTLYDLKSVGKPVTEMVLFDIDEKINKSYYLTAKKRKSNEG